MRIPYQLTIPTKPLFTWLSCCGKCPTNSPDRDPMSADLASLPTLEERMEHTFPCAWRPAGYCCANHKLQHYGLEQR